MANYSFQPQVQSALDFINNLAATATTTSNPIQDARDFYHRFIPLAGAAAAVHAVEDMVIDTPQRSIPIRIYRPSAASSLPVAVYFHGGWFYMGSLDTHDRPLRTLANAANCVVIAVDYALAPEHPFPAGLEDCYAAVQWVADHAIGLGIDKNRIAVTGDSAGGAMAAVVARQITRNNGPALVGQVLIYPVTDASLQTPSWTAFAEGLNLDLAGAKLAWSLYTPDATQSLHPDAAPLLAGDLSGLPPALVITAEFDPLRDEGMAYAAALRHAGVPVTATLYTGMIHGFFQMAGTIDDGEKAIQEVATWLRLRF